MIKEKIKIIIVFLIITIVIITVIFVKNGRQDEENKITGNGTTDSKKYTVDGKEITSEYYIFSDSGKFEIYRTVTEEIRGFTGFMGEEIMQRAGVLIRLKEGYMPEEKYCYISPVICQGKNVVDDWGVGYDPMIVEAYLPDGCHRFGRLYECDNLEKVVISSTVEDISLIANCPALKEITFSENIQMDYFPEIFGCDSLEKIVMPDSVKYMTGSLSSCESLKEVQLSPNLYHIGAYSFENCEQLETLDIPDSVTEIEEGCFSKCPNLTLIVGKGSAAEQYAIDNGLKYVIRDSID